MCVMVPAASASFFGLTVVVESCDGDGEGTEESRKGKRKKREAGGSYR